MRQWAYDMFGNEKIIKFVAMVTPEDLKVSNSIIDNFFFNRTPKISFSLFFLVYFKYE